MPEHRRFAPRSGLQVFQQTAVTAQAHPPEVVVNRCDRPSLLEITAAEQNAIYRHDHAQERQIAPQRLPHIDHDA